MMNFTQAITAVFGKYATFRGRARRSEFWWWMLFVILLSIAAQTLDGAVMNPYFGFGTFNPAAGQPLSLLLGLALLLPNLSVSIRRLHDCDRTGWWILISLVPLIGFIVLLIFYVQRGTEGPNQHGPDPLPPEL